MTEETNTLSQLETSGIITREGDWYRVSSFAALPQNFHDRIARLEQDDSGIRVKFLNQSELDAIVKDMDIPTL
ncbi:MAG: hypothetical protein GY814_19115 [Gammaproteobacteria bacterium]|nr:hypothetical protein [Gammaproteobacteria bacterium]